MQAPSSRKFFKAIFYLILTNAPILVITCYIQTYLQKNKFSKNQFLNYINSEYKFSTDWFTGNIPYWMNIFNKYHMTAKNLSCLEIGSWEGRSSLFILEALPNSELVCVDTWSGADEHKGSEVLNQIEVNFDHNLSIYMPRLKKYKGTSYSFFDQLDSHIKFDLIYVDGSHYVDDVLVDAVKSFAHLNVGGIMIFDDFFWGYYDDLISNPASAINAFISLKRKYLKVELVYSQIIISRISEEKRSNH
jgi:predicted O-methyltransferase YrrM